MNSKRLLIVFVAVLLASDGWANNTYFTPGDAFFYCEIEQAEWKRLKSGQLKVLKYDRPEYLPFAFCGYSGCEFLDISGLPASFRENVITAIEMMKEKHPTEWITQEDPNGGFFGAPPPKTKVEANKIRVFIYERSFDFSKHRIGLKYNEDWPRWAKDRGYEMNHFKYDFFISDAQAIAESWQFGVDVAPLELKLPQPQRGYVESPVAPNVAKIKFLIAPPIEINSLAYPVEATEHSCYVVTEESVQRLTVDQTKSPRGCWQLSSE
ncbi:MAG: hypothetical protein AAFX06_17095 [Planctomycetota bacterium]